MPKDTYEQVTATIVAMLETGEADPAAWSRPWSVLGLVHHSADRRPYRGINTLLLAAAQLQRGYELPVWATYRQWQAHDAQVQRGERATTVILWKLSGAKEAD